MTRLINATGLRRVAITGIGLVTPFGVGREVAWQGAINGVSTTKIISSFDSSECGTHFACEVPDFEPTDFLDKRTARRMDRFSQLAVAASRLALDDSGVEGTVTPDRVGVMIGSGIGGIETFYQQVVVCRDRGADRVSPLFIPMIIANMAGSSPNMRSPCISSKSEQMRVM